VTTVTEIAIGLGLGLAIGVAVGWLLAESRLAQRFLAPYIIVLVSTPLIAFAPLLATWFGYGILSKGRDDRSHDLRPDGCQLRAGLQRHGPRQGRAHALALREPVGDAAPAKLPAALPSIFTGMRISSVLAVIAVVVAEFIGSTEDWATRCTKRRA
jgi:NitT/TauT family transport system permease protein